MRLTTPSPESGFSREPPETWEYSLKIPHDPAGPAVVRATVRTVLGRHGLRDLMETAELLTSELATNAYRHSAGPASVWLKWRNNTLRISVWDTNPSLPAPMAPDPDSESGRGLQLVRRCADNWGRYSLGEEWTTASGKVVWFEIKRHEEGARAA
jgi:anti-sigma regulatory factor (Ser/Thr protein kinase)